MCIYIYIYIYLQCGFQLREIAHASAGAPEALVDACQTGLDKRGTTTTTTNNNNKHNKHNNNNKHNIVLARMSIFARPRGSG